MFDLPGPLGTFANLLVIIAGFGFIIFIHELGHFLAAKWAGIRVLAFSMGVGQIVCSYRKGVGLRRGSSEPIYLKRARGLNTEQAQKLHDEISPTEYRLSLLPIGGYVKMLGQEDLNPEAVSDEPDSYQRCTVPKRMVVISAGVIMNLISAAALFIIVFMMGLKVFPARVGFVAPDGPAASATVVNRDDVTGGLKRGDTILTIEGKKMYSFEHVMPEIAMSRKGQPVTLTVERRGVEGAIEFSVLPTKSDLTGMLDIGVERPFSTRFVSPKREDQQRAYRGYAQRFGLGSLEFGDIVTAVNDQAIHSPFDLLDHARDSGGQTLTLTLERAGASERVQVRPVPAMQQGVALSQGEPTLVEHLLGLSAVMMVPPNASQQDTAQGLLPGDVFARIGAVEYPSLAQGIATIRQNAGKAMDLVVLREDEQGVRQRVKLSVKVTPEGTIGFPAGTTESVLGYVSAPLALTDRETYEAEPEAPLNPGATPAQSLIELPGSRIIRVGDVDVSNLRQVQTAIVEATQAAYRRGEQTLTVPVTMELPLPPQGDGAVPTTTQQWTLTRADVERVRELGWTLPGGTSIVMLFDFDQIIDKSDGPIAAVQRGLAESRRVMMQTYLTFLRLFEGSLTVKHLKGPVGIAHLGTQIASQGFIWVLFFMAMISINLAVINFLPLPIVDGGQFLMLLYEGIRGRPVPIVVQNAATMAGLLLIGTVFLYVTFNDVKAIFGV